MGGISITQLLIIAVIVVLLFGTKKLRGLGNDLGASIKGFKKALNDDDAPKTNKQSDTNGSDADFTAKSIQDSQSEKKAEESKSHNKDQV
ncbi:twin-arginine translocase subunit TatE [Rouxiella sp. Mn2063]|uniref:twin-arginine translocase subunit TatE n=1 Tax=Rouxiella sp. Mn2063 TaxID=3395262 RepID=UPI003BDC3B31